MPILCLRGCNLPYPCSNLMSDCAQLNFRNIKKLFEKYSYARKVTIQFKDRIEWNTDLLFGSFECLHTPIADQGVRVLITHMYYISLNRNLTDCDQRLSNKWCQWSQSSNKGACWNLYSSDILCSTSVDHFKPPSLCEPLSFFGNLKDGLQGA